MSLPTTPPYRPYAAEISLTQHGLELMASAALDGYRRFWSDPPTQAVALNEQAAFAGITAQGVFANHAAVIGLLAALQPERLATVDLTLPGLVPIQFLDGAIDTDQLATDWAAYIASLPVPEIPHP